MLFLSHTFIAKFYHVEKCKYLVDCDGSSLYIDRKSTRLNSSHANISYAVFCLKKKKLNKSFQTYCHDYTQKPQRTRRLVAARSHEPCRLSPRHQRLQPQL